jgi:hypothetical protein
MTNYSSNTPFIGTWMLVSQQSRRSDGTLYYPRGASPQGVLMYDAAGNMAVQLARAEHTGGDMASFATAMSDYLGYYGTYTVDEAASTVLHHVSGSSYPGYIGTTQTRRYSFEDDTLILSASGTGADGIGETRVLVWQRKC